MRAWLSAAALVLALAGSAQAGAKRGVVTVDSFTFDKLVDGTRHVLVKFDKEYPYGEKEDEFREFAKLVAGLKGKAELLVGEVGIQDYGDDKYNEALRDRFGVTKNADEFPEFRLFRKGEGDKHPITFKGEVKADALARFVKTEAGVWIGLPGCLEAFDKLAEQYMGATTPEARKAILQQAVAANDKVLQPDDQVSAKYYLSVMKKIMDKGAGFVEQEVERLQTLLDSKITDEKKEQFARRLNILPSFTAPKK
eukprot:TRINITY_DN212_c0_g1_i1.p1 TRINITY_DN212_c0_g1~~TRINITY_DN212_c0_g1_i1.p1  ORF type:complete len:253 (+),score=124.98 TRINITY_DN212_c0_g1_i1:83-841(+)